MQIESSTSDGEAPPEPADPEETESETEEAPEGEPWWLQPTEVDSVEEAEAAGP